MPRTFHAYKLPFFRCVLNDQQIDETHVSPYGSFDQLHLQLNSNFGRGKIVSAVVVSLFSHLFHLPVFLIPLSDSGFPALSKVDGSSEITGFTEELGDRF